MLIRLNNRHVFPPYSCEGKELTTWDINLSGVHKDIATDKAKVLHVLAGPGTGKTFAMIRRVARLLEQGVSPSRILAVTFTRTAARDLREQLVNIGVPGADQVKASTLHSLCFSILGSQAAFAFTHRTPRPLLSYEINCLEADLAKAFGGKRKTRKLLEAYEAAWARLQKDDPGHPQSTEDQQFETALLAWLRFHQAMLIGELVPLTYAFLNANPALPVLPVLDHVLVDEYQDLNKADQSLIRALIATSSFLVIGDDNQSIYSFRYANPDGIRTFPHDVVGTKEYKIEECRRCPPNIVSISNSLISHDPHSSRPVPLKPDTAKPVAQVFLVQHTTLAEEIAAIADYVDHYIAINPEISPGRILILAPRRFIGNAIKDALIAKGRNALSYFQEDALASEAAAEGFCLLTLLVNKADRAAIRAWLGFGALDRNTLAYHRVRKFCESNNVPLEVVLEGLATGTITISHTEKLGARWRELKARVDGLQSLTRLTLVDALWPATAVNVTDVRSLAARIAYSTPEPSDMLEELRTAITQPELPGSDSDIIQVMSLHKAKGLTRDVVIVAGCMAGILPLVDDSATPEVQSAQLDEQRRLFYVAITRAAKVLVISAAASLPLKNALRGGMKVTRRAMRNGEPYALTTFSPFVSELGPTAPAPMSSVTWRRQVGL